MAKIRVGLAATYLFDYVVCVCVCVCVCVYHVVKSASRGNQPVNPVCQEWEEEQDDSPSCRYTYYTYIHAHVHTYTCIHTYILQPLFFDL